MAGSGSIENLPRGGGGDGVAPGGAADAEAGAGGEEEVTDEEMARRMQEQEEREFQQRLLALAGIGAPGTAGGSGEADEAGAAEAEEYLSEDDVDPDDLSYEEVRCGCCSSWKGYFWADNGGAPQFLQAPGSTPTTTTHGIFFSPRRS